MTYILYNYDGAGGFVVEAALVKAGAPFKIVIVDTSKGEQMTPEFTALNPLHQVPALVLPDGTLMTESAACVIHLSCAYPGAGLAPEPGSPAHGVFVRWMVFMSVNLYEADLRIYYPQRYTADAACAEAVKAAGQAHMRRSFAIVEDALATRPFLCGESMSMADVYLAMFMQWDPEKVATPGMKAVERAVAADPVIGPVWRRHGF
jgi:glutathione S-transferase